MSQRDTSTRQLTRAMARGEADAIGRFYNDYFEAMFAEARRASRRDEQFCLDVVQDAMLKIIRSVRKMESDAQLSGWTRRLVRNTTYDLLRAELRRKKRETLSASDSSHPDRPRKLEDLEAQLSWLAAELHQMGRSERWLLSARFGWGWTLTLSSRQSKSRRQRLVSACEFET